MPEKLHELQRLWLIEATRYNVLPLDDRRAERFNADIAGRPRLVKGDSQLLFGGMGRLTEGSVVVIKNKSFSVTAEVEVPASAMGDITGDLNSRRGRIQGMDTIGNLQIIRAQVPLKEMRTYSTDLRSMTAGEGSYSFTLSHYDVLPARLAEEVRAGFKAADED